MKVLRLLFCCASASIFVGCGSSELIEQAVDQINAREESLPAGEEDKEREVSIAVAPVAGADVGLESQELKPVGDTTNQASERRAKIIEIRESVTRKSFQSLTLGGRTYQSATVKEITDSGVKFSHAGGVASLSWEGLSDRVKDAWGFDHVSLEEKKQEEAANLARKAAWERSPEGIAAKERAEKEQLAKAEREKLKKKESLQAQVRKLTNDIARGNDVIEALEESFKNKKDEYDEEDKQAALMKGYIDYDGYFVGNPSIGGISTSSADRSRQLGNYQTRIVAAKAALRDLEEELQAAQDGLANLE